MKTFKLLLSSLYKNDSCIEGGRSKPWFFAIIMAILSLILAVIPITFNQLNVSGAGFISGSSTYGYEVGLTRFTETLYENNIHLIVKEDSNGIHYLECEKENDISAWETTFASNPATRYEHRDSSSTIDFCVYYTTAIGDAYSTYVSRVKSGVNPIDGSNFVEGETSIYTHFIVLGKYQVQSYMYKPGSTTENGSVKGDYDHIDVGYDLYNLSIVRIVDSKDANIIYTMTPDSQGNEYELFMSGSFNLWKDFFYNSYIAARNTATWQTTLLMLGIDALLVIFMGLMIFILTRGKKNPFRIYTFWETQKIAYWASITPAILSLILGFILSTYAVMMFILILGVRVMWMSMKSLRPIQ